MILVNVINLQSCLPPQHNTSWPRVSDLWLPGMRHIHIIDHRMMAAGRAHARRLTRRRPDRHDDADFPVLLKGEGDGYNASVWRDGADSERTAKIASVHQFDFVLKSEGAGYLDRIWFFNASLEGFILCYITVSHVWKPHPMGWC